MNSTKIRNIILAKEYIHSFVYNQNFSIANDLFHDNCLINNNFGFSFGPGIYTQKSSFWHAFKPLRLDILDEVPTYNCATYHYQIILKHVRPYHHKSNKIIEPTKNEACLDVTLNIQSEGHKIIKTFISSDLEDVVELLIGTSSGLKNSKPNDPLNLCEDFLKTIQDTLLTKGFTLTRKQTMCLCLWFVGKTDKQIAEFLDYSRSNIHVLQEKIRAAFGTNNKFEVFDRINEFKIDHLFYECYLLMLTYGISK